MSIYSMYNKNNNSSSTNNNEHQEMVIDFFENLYSKVQQHEF